MYCLSFKLFWLSSKCSVFVVCCVTVLMSWPTIHKDRDYPIYIDAIFLFYFICFILLLVQLAQPKCGLSQTI